MTTKGPNYCTSCGIKFSDYIHYTPKFCPNCGCLVQFENKNHTKCTICHKIINSEQLVECPYCNNLFHYKCMLNWVSRHNVCPICMNSYIIPKNKI